MMAGPDSWKTMPCPGPRKTMPRPAARTTMLCPAARLNVGDHLLNHHMMLRTARGNDASELAAGIEVANIALLLVVLHFAFPIPAGIEPPVRRFNLLLAFRHRPRIVRIFFLGNTLLRHCWFRIFRLRLGFGRGWGFGLRSTLLRHSHRRHESHG